MYRFGSAQAAVVSYVEDLLADFDGLGNHVCLLISVEEK